MLAIEHMVYSCLIQVLANAGKLPPWAARDPEAPEASVAPAQEAFPNVIRAHMGR